LCAIGCVRGYGWEWRQCVCVWRLRVVAGGGVDGGREEGFVRDARQGA
jgi:hypothetical protein